MFDHVGAPVFNDDNLLPLSGLQHLEFCERQWALIHIEQVWAEKRLTAEGRVLHERVHESDAEGRPDVIICRGLALRCARLRLSGQADVVEFHRAAADDPGAIIMPGRAGRWQPFPLEYKPASSRNDELGARLVRARMQISAGGRHASMTESSLHQVNWRAVPHGLITFRWGEG